MFRTILGFFLAGLFLILTLPLLGLQWIVQRFKPHFGERAAFRIIQFAFRLVSLPLGIKLEVKGKENIPTDRPCLFIGNHRSYLDVVLMYPHLPSITGFISKQDFEKVPIMPIWMKRLYCGFLVKDDIKQNLQIILQAIDYVKQGVYMTIYPEGQRGTGEDERELLPFHEGSFKIATKTGCPIVPVAVCGTRERFEKTFPRATAGKVIIEFGTPIEVAGLSREELKGIGARTREIVSEMVRRNHDLL